MKDCSAIKAPNVSMAWLAAVEHLLNSGRECYNLMVVIQRPAECQPPIHQAYEQMIGTHRLLSLKQVTYTIFPRSVYLQVGQDPNRLFERYNRPGGVYDRLRRKHGRRFGWGSYFRRMTYYAGAENGGRAAVVNQLGDIINMMRTRDRTHKVAYTISILIPGVDGRRTIGGPCLNHLALQLESPRVLNLMAVYRNHDFIANQPSYCLGDKMRHDVELPRDVSAKLDVILAEYGGLSEAQIKTRAYLTEPVKSILKRQRQGARMLNHPVFDGWIKLEQ